MLHSLIYVAWPMDQSEGTKLPIDEIDHLATLHGVSIVVPAHISMRGPDPRPFKISSAALAEADAMIAFLPKGVASNGVPMEIERTLSRGRWVAVVTNFTGSQALQREGIIVCTSLEDAFEALANLLQDRPHHDNGGRDLVLRVRKRPNVRDLQSPKFIGDTGIDLPIMEGQFVNPGWNDLHVGVEIELPPETWGMIVPRSSTTREWRFLVPTAIIDNGYRGPYLVGFWNLQERQVWIPAGTRLAQLVIMPLLTHRVRLEHVDELSSSDRGTAGFGSTGK